MAVGVVGCGVAGQAASILLADAGHAVTVFERFAEPRPIGAGLLLQPTGLAVLRELGLADEAMAQGARVVGLEGRTQRGRSVLGLRYADLHPKAFGLGIRRSALFDLLHARLSRSPAKLVTGAEIVDVAQGSVVDKQGVRHGPFDLVVIADGAHSALRARLMPAARAPLYPWGCVWTTVPDLAGLGAAGLLRQRVHGTTVMMGLLPVGQGQMTMFWSLPVESLAPGQSIDLRTWRRTAGALWPEAAAMVDYAAAADDFTRATYRHVALPRWNDGPVLFIGDAAHGTSPQLGQGANLGLLDAHALFCALSESDDLAAALAVFARRRSSTVRFYRQASHLLTPFFQSRLAPLGWLRDAFMGVGCHLPGMRPLMGSTLAGTRRGWLSSSPLDGEGRYPLSAPAWRSGPASGRSGPQSDA
ncbi:MAG: FAD-dependent urate hydroxylase [Rhodospirillaceae bacterium]|nr:FAD-dependent urate hydroxylase [Rhodospirillaceae bacterium]